MANAYITPQVITKEALRILKNELVFANMVDKKYEDQFDKIGDTLRIRKPVAFTTRVGATYSAQDIEEANHSLVQLTQRGVDFEMNTRDLTLTVDRFSDRYIKPAMIELAQHVDSEIAGQYKKIYNFEGTPGTTPANFLALGAAMRNMDEHAVPSSDRWAALDPEATLQVSNDLKSLNQNDGKAKTAFENAVIGRYAKFSTVASNSIVNHTVGVNTGTPLVDGAAQNVTYAASKNTWTQSLVTDGWTNSITDILLEGDVFTIDGVNSVNPRTRQSTGKLQDFVVRADADSGATTGPATLTISPPIITSGPYQTVDAAPADDAAINVEGTGGTQYPQNMCFHKEAIALAMVEMEIPEGASFSSRASDDGVSIRLIKDYDITNDVQKCRFDIQFATDLVHHNMAVRLTG